MNKQEIEQQLNKIKEDYLKMIDENEQLKIENNKYAEIYEKLKVYKYVDVIDLDSVKENIVASPQYLSDLIEIKFFIKKRVE